MENARRCGNNTGVVFEILDKHGYEYDDFELPNPFGQRFVIGDKENWIEKAAWYYSDKSQPLKIPWVMAAFFARFKVIDFRGELTNFENISGDGGPQILINEKTLIDNYVIDFTEEFEVGKNLKPF